MAVIYLKHPIHGAKVAISDMEAENDFQNGWDAFDPSESLQVEAEIVPDEVPAEVVNALPAKRRGRPPRTL